MMTTTHILPNLLKSFLIRIKMKINACKVNFIFNKYNQSEKKNSKKKKKIYNEK